MFKKLTVLLLLLICFTVQINAQEDPARLRIMQLSFVPEVSSTIDIRIEDELVFELVSWPFTTPYLELVPGEHTLTTTTVDAEGISASTTLMLESGHDYVVIVEGDYSKDAVQFVVIDETDAPRDETGSVALIVNLTPEPVTYSVNDEVLIERIPPGEHRFAALPQDFLSVSAAYVDAPDEPIYEREIDAVLDLSLLNVLRVTAAGDPQGFLQRTSPATIAEFLLTFEEAALFGDALITQLEAAAASGTYTLFAPTVDALLAMEEVPTNPDDLVAFITGHIALADIPPYDLIWRDSVTMFNGNVASVDTVETDSGFWEIEGVPIWFDVRFADGTVYVIDGVIAP